MKRIIQIAAAVMLGSLLAAPSLFAQTLTSKTEYWDYWRTRISSKYTVLPNGEKHGQQYLYDKSGTLRESNMWDKGTRKSLVRYYENGRPQIKAKIVTKLVDLCTEYTSYNIDGSVNTQYTMVKVPGNETSLFPNGYGDRMNYGSETGWPVGEWTLKSYSDKYISYKLSSDNKMVDIVGKKSGSKYTYDIAKESVKLIAYDCTDYYGDYKVSYKNGTLSINLLDEKYDIFVVCDGFVYCVNKISAKCPNLTIPVSKWDFAKRLNTCSIERDSWAPYEYIDIQSTDCFYESDVLSAIPADLLCKDVRGVLVKVLGKKFYLKLVEGTKADGIWEHKSEDGKSYVKLTTAGDKIASLTAKLINKNGVVKEYTGGAIWDTEAGSVKRGINQIYYGYQLYDLSGIPLRFQGEGCYAVTDESSRSSCDKQVYEGTFEFEADESRSRLVSGKISLYRLPQFNIKSLVYTIDTDNTQIEYNKGATFVGKYPVSDLDDISSMAKIKQSNVFAGVYVVGDHRLEGRFNLQYNDSRSTYHVYYIGGKAIFPTSGGKYEGEFSNNSANGQGRFIDSSGNIFEGKFSGGYLSIADLSKVTYKFPTGEIYEGEVHLGKLHGAGKLMLPNGDVYDGVFANNKFSGTGEVHVTTKNGVYEGAVEGFKCKNDGVVAKIKAPKVPRFKYSTIYVEY